MGGTVQIEESNQVYDETSGGGAGDAAEIDLENRVKFDVVADLSTAGNSLEIEVSETGDFSGEEFTHTSVASGDLSTSSDNVELLDTAFRYARAYYDGPDGDVNTIAIVAKGVS